MAMLLLRLVRSIRQQGSQNILIIANRALESMEGAFNASLLQCQPLVDNRMKCHNEVEKESH